LETTALSSAPHSRQTELRLAHGDDRNWILARTAVDDPVIDPLLLKEPFGVGYHDRRARSIPEPAELRDRRHLLRLRPRTLRTRRQPASTTGS
jgi:hypothetical protein